MGNLILAAVGTEPSVEIQQPVETVDNVIHISIGGQGQHHIVECTFHVIGSAKRCSPHPQNAIAFKVREYGSRTYLVDIFGRKRNSHDGQGLTSPVDDCSQFITGHKIVSLSKGLVHHHFVVPAWFCYAPPPQIEPVQQRFALIGY